MNIQMLICILLFAAMLVSFLIGKLPLGVTAGTVAALLVLTGCTAPATILNGIGSANAVTICCMIILAVGLGQTTFPARLTAVIRKITGGSYRLAYLGILLIAMALTSMLTSPMAVYAIVFPLMDSVCDEFGVGRSKAQFPLVIVCLGCASILPLGSSISRPGGPCSCWPGSSSILPLGSSISQAAVYNGYLQTYGFSQEFTAMDFFRGRWPFLLVTLAWALFLAPKFTPEKPVVPIASLAAEKAALRTLSRFSDVAGVVLFVLVILGFLLNEQLGIPVWFLSFAGVMAMVLCGTLSKKEAIQSIPVEICLLYVGANTVAAALVETGTADCIGAVISRLAGGATNTVALHTVFFLVPFIITQFMQNQSVMNVFAPIALITCSALGADPRGCLVLVTAGSRLAFMTPSPPQRPSPCAWEQADTT